MHCPNCDQPTNAFLIDVRQKRNFQLNSPSIDGNYIRIVNEEENRIDIHWDRIPNTDIYYNVVCDEPGCYEAICYISNIEKNKKELPDELAIIVMFDSL